MQHTNDNLRINWGKREASDRTERKYIKPIFYNRTVAHEAKITGFSHNHEIGVTIFLDARILRHHSSRVLQSPCKECSWEHFHDERPELERKKKMMWISASFGFAYFWILNASAQFRHDDRTCLWYNTFCRVNEITKIAHKNKTKKEQKEKIENAVGTSLMMRRTRAQKIIIKF